MLRTIGINGQISIGKEYAGRHVLINKLQEGVWIVKLGEFIPDDEKWLAPSQISEKIDLAVQWTENHPPTETHLDSFSKKTKKRSK